MTTYRYTDLYFWAVNGYNDDKAKLVTTLNINYVLAPVTDNIFTNTIWENIINKMTNITTVNMELCDLSNLTPYIWLIAGLTELNIFNSGLYKVPNRIPPSIYTLTNLTKLVISGCSITEIDPEIKNLTKLEMLSLSNNNIKKLIPELGELSELVHLDISYNSIKKLIPELGKLTKLTCLDYKFGKHKSDYLNMIKQL